MGWVSPTGFVDPGSVWASEERAYDGDPLDHWCAAYPNPESWTGFLELTHSAILCDKVRVVCWGQDASIESIDLDGYWDGGWHGIFAGGFPFDEWVEHNLDPPRLITALRINLYNAHPTNNYWANINEVAFGEVEVAVGRSVGLIIG